MTEIEKIWKAAKAERGDMAFELFDVYRANGENLYVSATNNTEVEQEGLFLLKPLDKLIELDIKQYGSDAFLMYKVRNNNFKEFQDPLNNTDVLDIIESEKLSLCERKLYANVPFNIQWANTGLSLEINCFQGWVKCNSKTFEKRKFPFVELDGGFLCSENNLRHPFPPLKET